MISRRGFVTGSLTLFAAPLGAGAQQAATIRTVGILGSRPERSRPFEEALRERGWIEGKTVRFERRVSIDYQELPRLAKELVEVPVDVIFALYGVSAVMDVTRTVPIIGVMGDPVGAGLIMSLARPGGNLTGIAMMSTELAGKRLEILTQALPTARRIAVLANPDQPTTKANLHETEARARARGVQLLRFEASAPDRFADVLAEVARKRPDALVVLSDPMFTRHSGRLVAAVARHRLPAMFEWREFVDAGGLMAYGPGLDDLSRRAAGYVDQVLKGAKPGDLPVEQATKFELFINMKTAKALGLTIPPSLLLRADQVIE
jgi:putative ABC transport system substrate-binding protein